MPATSRIAVLAEADQRLVEQDRLDRPDPLPLDVDRLLGGEALAGLLRLGRASPRAARASRWRWSRSCSAVSTTDVTIPGLQTTPPDVQTAPSPVRARDVADLERELRRAGERVAALVHRRRAGVRRLAAPRDAVALDAERAEHDAERQIERLEHRPLLDVQLEVGGGGVELPRARRARGRGRRRARRARPAADSVAVRAAGAARPGRPSSRRPRSSRTGCGRSARPPRRPS